MYDRNLDGRELTFGVSGKLWKNVLIMYDRQTGSLWSHLMGEAVVGPLTGKRLTMYPAVMLTYAEWKKLHPDTLVLEKGGRGLFGSSRDPYEGYYYSSRTGIIPEKYRDKRLHPKTFIIGLTLPPPAAGGAKAAKAYPFADLNRAGVVNDTFAGRDLLVAYCEGAKAGVVFDRRMDGKVLTFSPEPAEGAAGAAKGEGGSCRYMRDGESGSRWLRLTGLAVEGPMKGKRLEPIQSTQAFWFGWKDYYPKSEVYRHPN